MVQSIYPIISGSKFFGMISCQRGFTDMDLAEKKNPRTYVSTSGSSHRRRHLYNLLYERGRERVANGIYGLGEKLHETGRFIQAGDDGERLGTCGIV